MLHFRADRRQPKPVQCIIFRGICTVISKHLNISCDRNFNVGICVNENIWIYIYISKLHLFSRQHSSSSYAKIAAYVTEWPSRAASSDKLLSYNNDYYYYCDYNSCTVAVCIAWAIRVYLPTRKVVNLVDIYAHTYTHRHICSNADTVSCSWIISLPHSLCSILSLLLKFGQHQTQSRASEGQLSTKKTTQHNDFISTRWINIESLW